MKKILLALLVVAIIAVSAVGMVACNNKSDSEYILGKGELVCGITLYEPMNYKTAAGDYTGFETDFANAVCEELGIKARFEVINWSTKEIELKAKNIDCIWNGFTYTDERAENIQFSKKYLKNAQCIVVKTADLAQYTTKDSCADKKAAVEKDSAGEEAAKEMSAATNVTSVDTQMLALTEVKAGTSDYAVLDITLASSVVGKGDYSGLSIVSAIKFDEEYYAVGFRKGSDMADKVNEAIDKLIENGKLLEIATKYGLQDLLVNNK